MFAIQHWRKSTRPRHFRISFEWPLAIQAALCSCHDREYVEWLTSPRIRDMLERTFARRWVDPG